MATSYEFSQIFKKRETEYEELKTPLLDERSIDNAETYSLPEGLGS